MTVWDAKRLHATTPNQSTRRQTDRRTDTHLLFLSSFTKADPHKNTDDTRRCTQDDCLRIGDEECYIQGEDRARLLSVFKNALSARTAYRISAIFGHQVHFVDQTEDQSLGWVLQNGFQARLVIVEITVLLSCLYIKDIDQDLHVLEDIVPLAREIVLHEGLLARKQKKAPKSKASRPHEVHRASFPYTLCLLQYPKESTMIFRAPFPQSQTIWSCQTHQTQKGLTHHNPTDWALGYPENVHGSALHQLQQERHTNGTNLVLYQQKPERKILDTARVRYVMCSCFSDQQNLVFMIMAAI